MSRQIVYVPWSDLHTIEGQPGLFCSIEPHHKLVAIGKLLTETYVNGFENVRATFESLQSLVREIAAELNINVTDDALMNDLLVEVEWIIEDEVHDEFDYLEAQIRTYTDLIASRLAFLYFATRFECKWLDARDVVVTYESWTSAEIDMEMSRKRGRQLAPETIYITTHGIGSTSSNENTRTMTKAYWSEILK